MTDLPPHVHPEPIGPPDARVFPRFSGPDTFARLPRLDDVDGTAGVAVLGVPFDAGTSYRPGARFGPAAIRAGSKLLRPYHPELEVAARAVLSRADRLVTLGGDHTIALPLLRATHERHGPVALVHFDAHPDTWDTYFGAPFTHGTPFRRAVEEGLLAEERSVHVGLRGPLYSQRDLDDDRALGFAAITTAHVARAGTDEIIDRIRQRVGERPVYLSIDVDVLDPAHAPGTGTPEPGGLTTRELQVNLRGLVGLPVAGADIVEVAPAYDHAELTSLAAANVAYEILALLARL
jgi:agmatinase